MFTNFDYTSIPPEIHKYPPFMKFLELFVSYDAVSNKNLVSI